MTRKNGYLAPEAKVKEIKFIETVLAMNSMNAPASGIETTGESGEFDW